MYPLLQPIFNKGGAGRSMTREESVEAVDPLVREHQKLLHAYDAAIRTLKDRDLAAQLNSGMNRARTELAKLRETIYSLGGDTSNGTDLDPDDVHLGDSDAAIVHALDERERAYRDALQDTLKMSHHQMRSIAILENNVAGSNARIETLYPFVTRMRKPERRAESRPEPVPTDNTATPVDLAPDEQHAREQPAIDIPDRR